MKPKGIFLLGAAAAILAAGVLCAEERTMKPGEYEMTTEMKMEGMNHEMPPTTFRHCYTPEDVKDSRRIAQGTQQRSSDCEIKDMKTVGSHASWSMTCKSGAKFLSESSPKLRVPSAGTNACEPSANSVLRRSSKFHLRVPWLA